MATTGKPTLHHLNNSQSQTILWLLEELGIDYDLKLHERIKSRAPPALKETHPLGRSPQLVTPSGRVIIERSAIALYLIETYDTQSRLQIPTPPAAPEDDAVREEMLISFANATLQSLVMLDFIFGALAKTSPFFIRPLAATLKFMLDKAYLGAEIDAAFKYLDSQLDGGREFLMGGQAPTRADFIMFWDVDWAFQGKVCDMSRYPNIDAWRKRCIARDAWKRSLEKGNGYDMSLKI